MKEFLEWLERVLPTILAAFGLGYKAGQGSTAKLESELSEVKLELKIKENHEQIERDNIGVSDVDGVNKIAGPKE